MGGRRYLKIDGAGLPYLGVAPVMVESSDPMVVEASQAEGEGEVTAVAGLVAKGKGTATITVKDTSIPEESGG